MHGGLQQVSLRLKTVKVAGSTIVDLAGLTGLEKGEVEAPIALEIADKIGLDLSDPKSWNEV